MITTEQIEYCKIRVNYTAEPNVVADKQKLALAELKNMPVPGFRPGKATEQALKLKYKDRINQWVERELLNIAHEDVLYETKLVNLAPPQIEKSSLNGTNFTCQMVYLTKPEFTLGQYKDMEIPEPYMEKTAEQLAEAILQSAREQHGNLTPYDENAFVQVGDKITLDFTIGEEVHEGQIYMVGSHAASNDFDENLFGMTPGETREFDIEKNGKRVACKATVHFGMKQSPAPLDNDLAVKCGVKDYDTLISTVNQMAQNQFKNARNEKVIDQIKNRLVATHEFECPPWLVTMEAQHIAGTEGVKWESLNTEAQEGFLARAKDNVKFTLILDSINKAEPDTVLSEMESVEYIKHVLKHQGCPNVEGWLAQASQSGQLMGLIAKTKTDHTCQWLLENNKVVQ